MNDGLPRTKRKAIHRWQSRFLAPTSPSFAILLACFETTPKIFFFKSVNKIFLNLIGDNNFLCLIICMNISICKNSTFPLEIQLHTKTAVYVANCLVYKLSTAEKYYIVFTFNCCDTIIEGLTWYSFGLIKTFVVYFSAYFYFWRINSDSINELNEVNLKKNVLSPFRKNFGWMLYFQILIFTFLKNKN